MRFYPGPSIPRAASPCPSVWSSAGRPDEVSPDITWQQILEFAYSTEFTQIPTQAPLPRPQLSLVGDRTILTVIFDDSTTLGMVRLYVNEGVRKMDDLFADIDRRRESEGEPEELLEGEFEDDARQQLDAFFDG